ncbi:MAG: hypothetical protein Q8Q09_03155 [Deltaproteobacteria bacterium]|nr:hypothetical protein [Deltaproteobacteria bacterium]
MGKGLSARCVCFVGLLTACDGGTPPNPCTMDGSPWHSQDASPPPPVISGETLTFVISAITLGPTPADSMVVTHGFNLDGTFTDEDGTTPRSCGKPDNLSSLDPEQNHWIDSLGPDGRARCFAPCTRARNCRGGVDNALPFVADLIEFISPARGTAWFRPAVTRLHREEHAPVVLVIRGVDSLAEDPEVRVQWVRAVALDGAPCDAGQGRRRYALHSAAVRNGDPAQPVIAEAVGSIRAGRLRVQWSDPLAIPLLNLQSEVSMWETHQARLAVDLSASRGTRGNFGGAVDAVTVTALTGPTTPSLIAGAIDLEHLGVCADLTSTPPRYGRVGIGFGFELTPAILEPRVLEAPPAGACPLRALSGADAGTDAGSDASRRD